MADLQQRMETLVRAVLATSRWIRRRRHLAGDGETRTSPTETKVVFPDDADPPIRQRSIRRCLYARRCRSLFRAAASTQPGDRQRRRAGPLPATTRALNRACRRRHCSSMAASCRISRSKPSTITRLRCRWRRRSASSWNTTTAAMRSAAAGSVRCDFQFGRHCLDYDFLHRNPEYRLLVQWIPCKQYNWLDFSMSDETKAGLFREVPRRAITFLRGFDWEAYKAYRQRLHTARQLLGG